MVHLRKQPDLLQHLGQCLLGPLSDLFDRIKATVNHFAGSDHLSEATFAQPSLLYVVL
jgi:hypothetical protein